MSREQHMYGTMLMLWLDHYGYRHMCCGKEMRHDTKIEGSCGWVCFQSHYTDIIISIVKSCIHGFQGCQESCRVKKLNNVTQLCPIIRPCPTWWMSCLKLFFSPHLLLLKSCHEHFNTMWQPFGGVRIHHSEVELTNWPFLICCVLVKLHCFV
jgi:hypothetical protein